MQALYALGLVLFSVWLLTACKEAPPPPGETVWMANCKVCHETGLAGAPIIGNKVAWTKRLTRGQESLYAHAINGWGDMPARGGNTGLTDEQVKQAVDYMLSKSQ
ncbi:MAG: c-type cytochrome [Cellvibrionales bacterium]|nr:c-type cytochrome [Cellvibrionales bacterium]